MHACIGTKNSGGLPNFNRDYLWGGDVKICSGGNEERGLFFPLYFLYKLCESKF